LDFFATVILRAGSIKLLPTCLIGGFSSITKQPISRGAPKPRQ
jgi:hypothetical protein